MHKLTILFIFSALLTSCSFFQIHKVEIEQGNQMTAAMVDRLHPGLTETQVKAIMGEPILVNILNNHTISYVYTSQVGSNPRIHKKVTLGFQQGVMTSMQRQGI